MEEQEILERLRRVQAEIKVGKGRTNKFGGYQYRSAEDILAVATPLLVKEGLTMVVSDIIEEKLSETKFKIKEGTVLKTSNNAKEIRKAYQEYKKQGMNVLYSLPNTTEEFIVENVPFKGMLV